MGLPAGRRCVARRGSLDVPIWWVWIGATIGVVTGIGLFAVLSMAADRETDEIDVSATTPTAT